MCWPRLWRRPPLHNIFMADMVVARRPCSMSCSACKTAMAITSRNHGRSKTSTGEHGTVTGKQGCARGRGSETPQCRQGQLGRADDGVGFVGCVVQWTFARMAASCRGSHVKNVLYYIISQKQQKIAFFIRNAPDISKKTIGCMALKYWECL